MRPASYQAAPDGIRRRAPALVLSLVVQLLMVLMLLRLAAGSPQAPEPERPPVTVELLPEPKVDTPPSRVVARTLRARGGAAPRKPAPPAATAAPPPPLDLIPLSREEFAASDIAALPARRASGPPAGAGNGAAGTGIAAADGPGTGPGGERLYNAEWYREPTDAELGFYLPAGGPRGGWGMIACQTVADYRVDRCIELDQSPPGSGLARALRQAAWQFRVRPPRIGGRPMVGAWVRIRVDFTRGER